MNKASFTVPAATHSHWLTSIRRSVLIAVSIASVSLAIGIAGYHLLGHLNWVDSLLEASMILGGMGPVAPMANDDVKVFASLYALFSGLVLLTTTSILLAPWLHKLMYHSHRQARCDAKAWEKETLKN